jgi:hypothetical protein
VDWRHYLILSLIAGISTSVAAVKMRRRLALGPLGRFAFFEHIVLPALLLSMAAFIFSVGLFVDTGGVDVNESMANMISAIIFGASLLLLAIVVPLFFPLIFPFYLIGGFASMDVPFVSPGGRLTVCYAR